MAKDNNKFIDPFLSSTGDEVKEEGKKPLNLLQEDYGKTTVNLEKKPGEYNISNTERRELINKKCPICFDEIEKVYRKTFKSGRVAIIGPGNKAYWQFVNTRCKNCRVVFGY